MRILVLSFYFEPDLSAGSFRATSLVNALRESVPPGWELDVVTTAPNRYSTYAKEAAKSESREGVEIHRIELQRHRSDMLGQSRAYLTFARRALDHVSGREYDLVFATSSRLMTAALGALISRRKQATLYLDIRDIFVDTIGEVLPWPSTLLARAGFSVLESWTIRRARRVNLVSRGFEDYFRKRYPEQSFAWFTNGIDKEFVAAANDNTGTRARRRPTSRYTVLYAGNIGECQSLHTVLPKLAHALRDRVDFVIIGDGGRRNALEQALRASRVSNVEVRAPVARSELLDAYRAADVLFLHLGAHAAFEKVLPSKLFEYGAMGKPVLAGVAGYPARFVQEEISNSATFPPGDVGKAIEGFRSLTIEDQSRPEFVARFDRASISHAMARDVLSLATDRRLL